MAPKGNRFSRDGGLEERLDSIAARIHWRWGFDWPEALDIAMESLMAFVALLCEEGADVEAKLDQLRRKKLSEIDFYRWGRCLYNETRRHIRARAKERKAVRPLFDGIEECAATKMKRDFDDQDLEFLMEAIATLNDRQQKLVLMLIPEGILEDGGHGSGCSKSHGAKTTRRSIMKEFGWSRTQLEREVESLLNDLRVEILRRRKQRELRSVSKAAGSQADASDQGNGLGGGDFTSDTNGNQDNGRKPR